MHKALFNITFLLIAVCCVGQDEINPERPGETRSPELVKGNHLQVEFGFRKDKISEELYLYEHPQATLRLGLFNALELRIDAISQTIKNRISKDKQDGFKPVYFGVKAKILPEYNWLPSIGALAQVGVASLASGDFFVAGIPFEFRTLFNNNITDRLSLQYNAGVAWNETDAETDNKQWMYSIQPMYKISDRVQVFIEQYAFLRNGFSAEHYFDGGLQYLINNDFTVDVAGGVGLSDVSSSYFLEAGFSYRLRVFK
jgi:hypothetical protein